MAVLLLLAQSPAIALPSLNRVVTKAAPPKSPAKIRTGPHKLTPVQRTKIFSANPSDVEISSARVFLEPLIPMSTSAVLGENAALATAITTFKTKKSDDISDFSKFLSSYPKSRWRASLEQNLGSNRFSNGYLSQALTLWKSSWELSKSESKHPQRDVADAAIADILLLDARVGRMSELETYFAQIEKRPILGTNEQKVISAKDGYKRMRNIPSESMKCGPYAIDSILYRNEKAAKRSDVVEKAKSTSQGTNLAQVSGIAKAVGLNYQMARKSPGAPYIVPSVIHWKLDHFAAITAEKNGLYRVKDPTFGEAGETWLTAKVLDAETDGFSLIPNGALTSGWSSVSSSEGQNVWGKGGAGGVSWGALGPASAAPPRYGGPYYYIGMIDWTSLAGLNDEDTGECMVVDCGNGPEARNWMNEECGTKCKDCADDGVAINGDRSMQATLNIMDTPLFYRPPIGPQVRFHLNYAWLEADQPSTYTFTNFGPNWTFQWLSYLTVDPITQAVTLRLPSGGSETYKPDPITGLYPNNFFSHSKLENIGGGVYRKTYINGAVEIYGQSDGSSPARVFMTERADPAGNSVLIQYDSDYRITSVTDALSQVSTFSYVSNTFGNSGFYKVASISDPFSRTAQFSYDSSNTNLLSITDAEGMQSQFVYDSASSFITAMTTPYGTTNFQNYTPVNSLTQNARGLRTTYPDGTSTVIESRIPHVNKTFFWDRNATKLYPDDPAKQDYSHCKVKRWCYDAGTNLLEPVLYSIERPLESIKLFKYPGQTLDFVGTGNRPLQVSQANGNQIVMANIGGTKTTGDVVTITVFDPLLIWSGEVVNYSVQAGDTLKTITSGLAAAINANANLKTIGVRATATQTTIGLSSQSPNKTNYTKSTSGGATETITLTPAVKQISRVSIGGTATSGETVSVWFLIAGNYTNVGYVVQPGDTLANVASGLASAITANATMITNQVSASAIGNQVNITGLQINLIELSTVSGATTKATLDYVKNGTVEVLDREYNEFGLITKLIDPIGRTFSYIYDTNKVDLKEVRETRNGNNFLLDYFEYNSFHEVTKHIDGSGQTTLITYNGQGQQLTLTDALSNVTTNTFTGGYLTSIDGPLSGNADVSTISYDSVGRVYQTADSQGYTLTFFYDNLNRPTETLFPDGTTSKTIYQRLDPILTKDRLGRWTQSAFDNMGDIEYVVDSEGRKTSFEWCTCGAIASLKDPKGQVTHWHHDVRGRTLEKAYADGSKVKFDYDPVTGRLLTKTDAMSQTTYFTYLSDGSPFQTDFINPVNFTSPVTVLYDENFSRVKSVQSDWGTTTYTFNNYITNPAGSPITGGGALQLIHNDVIPNSDITFQYDALGRVSNRDINSTANASSWAFDAIGRVTSETNSLGTFNYSYVDDTPGSSKGLSQLASASYPNGQTTKFDWYGNENDNRLRSIMHMAPGDLPRSQFAYAHNAGGEIIRWAQQNAGMTPQISKIGYDKVSQLRSSIAGDGSVSAPSVNQFFYEYDQASNRIAVQSATVENARIGGSITAGDTLTLTVKNIELGGGQKAINYVIQSGDSLSTAAAQLAAAICIDSDMQTLGVNAIANAANISVKSVSSNVTSYEQSTSIGATETIVLGVSQNAIQNLTIAGTPTAGDAVTVTVYDPVLSGGNTAVTYNVVSGNTLANIASGVAAAINANSSLSAAGITATTASSTVNLKSASQNLTTYKASLNSGATEKISLCINMNGPEVVVMGGSKTTGDVLSIKIYDQGLPGGSKTKSHTVLSGDTLVSIASALASTINGDSQLQDCGITASSSGTLLTVNSVSNFITSITVSRNAGATETLTPGVNQNGTQTAVIGGSKTTGDVLTIGFYDSGLVGGAKSVNYTVLSGDSLNSIASNIAAAINGDAALSTVGITASAVNSVIFIKSTSIHSTSFDQSVNIGATETIFLARGIGVTQAAHNNVNQVTNISPGGKTKFQGTTNKAIKAASVDSQAIVLTSKLPVQSSFTSSLSGVATESVTIDSSTQRQDGYVKLNFSGSATAGDVANLTIRNPLLPGGQQVVSYRVKTGDSLSSIAFGLATAVNANPYCFASSVGGSSGGSTLYVIQLDFHKTATACSCTFTGKATETIALGTNQNGNMSAIVGGTATIGDIISITIHNDSLPNGTQIVSRTVQSGDTLSSIAAALSTAINASSNLSSIGMTASSASSTVSIVTTGTTYSSSTSGGATETITLGYNSQGNSVATVGGEKTTGDVLTITTTNAALGGGSSNSSYTVQAGDSLVSIAAGLANAINANTALQNVGISASNIDSAQLASSTQFSASPSLPESDSKSNVVAIDGGNNVKSDLHQNHVQSVSSQTLSFDLNGNMTSDGTNTYKWDAQNRLIEIDYPGSGNKSEFAFDTRGFCAKITETLNSSVTSVKQFVWCSSVRCEERDGSGSLTKQFFANGQTISGVSYFYFRDHLGSIREMSDSSGIVRAEYSYGPYGSPVKVQGNVDSDFLYTGFYQHQPSGLSLTQYRQFSDRLGCWLSRDPLPSVPVGASIYAYVNNNPFGAIDPSGLITQECCYGNAKTRQARIKVVTDMLDSALDRTLAKFTIEANWRGLFLTALYSGAIINIMSKPITEGNTIDAMMKAEVKADKCLSILVRTTDSGAGPDIFSLNLKYWWDVTAAGSVATHKRYPGQGEFMPYVTIGEYKW